VPLAHEHLLQLGQQLRLVHPGQHERAPGDAQQRTQRGLVGAVAADVADDRVHRAGRAEDGVEEVAADERARAPRPVEGPGAHRAPREQGRGQQTALEACGLGGGQLLLPQPQQARLGSAPLHGVAHRPDQDLTVDLALDQVVLCPGRHRRHPEVLIVDTGQHAHRSGPVGAQDAAQPVEALRAGQVQIEQHAVRPAQQITREDGGHRVGHGDLERRIRLREQLLHQEDVARIVLDQQHAPRGGGGGFGHRAGRGLLGRPIRRPRPRCAAAM
jgi:hypothetical protein